MSAPELVSLIQMLNTKSGEDYNLGVELFKHLSNMDQVLVMANIEMPLRYNIRFKIHLDKQHDRLTKRQSDRDA